MAQAVALHLATQSGLARQIQVDSAGTRAVRGNQQADPRAKAVLSARGYTVGKNKSRQVIDRDFERYDLILSMDQSNLNDLRRLCPGEHTHKLRLFLEFANAPDTREVPDPYYGNVQGFERVLDLCEAGARGLVTYCQGVRG